jgi:transcriptional regulator GlxA family with amidase domain
LPYFVHVAAKDHGDSGVADLQAFMEEHYGSPITVADLARRSAMSQRTLNRRFRSATQRTPIEYLHLLRIEAAKRLLEATSLTVDEITARIGYEDPRSFSRLFRTYAGLPPRDYRKRFGEIPNVV